MADIITYPENGITYDADDAAGYLATRSSGVYSTEEDFSVTPAGELSVAVSAGQAWVRPARFKGRSIIMEQPATLTLTAADPVRGRIDRVVLRYDAVARQTSLNVLEGAPDSAAPTAPEITRTALIYDLCLAEISRPAGSTEITAANITDTRADEAVCGVMRDGVTGIPTAQLVAKWQAAQEEQSAQAQTAASAALRDLQQSTTAQLDAVQDKTDKQLKDLDQQAEELQQRTDELFSSYTGGYYAHCFLTIPASGWQATGSVPPWQQDVPLAQCKAVHVPQACVDPASRAAAGAASLYGVCDTQDGAVRFWAAQKPAADINVQVTLLGPGKEA